MLVLAFALLGGCASSDSGYSGRQYPPTDRVKPIFQVSQAPDSCRVFAHLFATMPAGMTTGDFSSHTAEEAKQRGADLVLIGQSRQCTTGSSLNYTYYGPDREYMVRDWPGWSFGFNEWEEQGNWAGIGYEEWMNSVDINYDYPIVMQVVLLRCREG